MFFFVMVSALIDWKFFSYCSLVFNYSQMEHCYTLFPLLDWHQFEKGQRKKCVLVNQLKQKLLGGRKGWDFIFIFYFLP